MASVGPASAPVHEQAVGPAIEHAVDPDGFGTTQTAAVVVARGVEPGVQSGFDAPVVDIGVEPLGRGEFSLGPAGDQLDGFRGPACPFTMHPGGLRHQGEPGGFSVEIPHHEGASHHLTFFKIGPAAGRRIFQREKRGEPGSGTCAATTACTPD